MTNYLSLAVKNYASNYVGLPDQCWQRIILTLVNSVSIGVCFFLSLYFVGVLKISVATTGILISCYGLGTVTGGVVGGKLSDKFPAEMISIISLFLQSAAFLCLTHIESIICLMFNLFILGIASYGFKTSNNTWVLSQCSSQSELRLKIIGITYVASNLGLGLSGVIIAEMSKYDFKNIFYISSILLFASAIFLITKKHAGKNESVNVSDLMNKPNLNKSNRHIVILILTVVFFIGLIVSQLSTTYPIYVRNTFPELGVKAVSILFILDTALIVLFQAPLTTYIAKFNKIFVVGLGAFLMGFGMLILNYSFLFVIALVSCVIWTTGEMLFMSTAQLVCYENGAEKKKGQTLGVFQSTYAASCVTGPTVGGMIYQHFGGNVLWYLSAMVGLLCFYACWHYRKYS